MRRQTVKMTDEQFVGFVEGVLYAHGIQPKELPVHESTISRFFNKKAELNLQQVFEIGFAAGQKVRPSRQAA